MATLYELPRGKSKEARAALASAMKQVLYLAKDNARPLHVQWIRVWMYMRGVRTFETNWSEGTVRVSWTRSDMKSPPFKGPWALDAMNKEFGRMMSIDVAPRVTLAFGGLSSLRSRAIHQLALDSMCGDADRNRSKREVIINLLMFGTSCLMGEILDDPALGSRARMTVVPPWEMSPIPYNPYARENLAGDQRDRIVPLRWLRSRFPGKVNKSTLADLGVRAIPFGDQPIPGDAEGSSNSSPRPSPRGVPGSSESVRKMMDDSTAWVHLHEVWLRGEDDSLARYVARANEVILDDRTFDAYEPQEVDEPDEEDSDVLYSFGSTQRARELVGARRYCLPLSLCRYIDTGGYYGQSFADKVVPFNTQAEELCETLFYNIKTMSRFGILALPNDLMPDHRTAFTKTNYGVTLFSYQPSNYERPVAPTQIQPHTTGSLPGETAAFAVNQLNQQAKDAALQLPARTDSPSAIGMIDEAGKRSLVSASDSMAEAYARQYEYVSSHAYGFYAQTKSLHMMRVDDNIVGVRLGDDGAVQLDMSTPPPTTGLVFDIRDRAPRSKEALRQMLLQLRMNGQIATDEDLAYLNYQWDAELPMPETIEFNTILATKMHNIELFGDGQTPGNPRVNPFSLNPIVAARYIRIFMSRPYFNLASDRVRQQFMLSLQACLSAGVTPMSTPLGAPAPDQMMGAGQAPPVGGSGGQPPNQQRTVGKPARRSA